MTNKQSRLFVWLFLSMLGMTQNAMADDNVSKTYTDEKVSVVFAMSDVNNPGANTKTPEDAFSIVSFDYGNLTLDGVKNITKPGGEDSGIPAIKFSYKSTTNSLNWFVRPAAGLTFTPTRVQGYVNRDGTDVEKGVVLTAKKTDGEVVELGTYTAWRQGKDANQKDYDKDAIYMYDITLTADQQAKLEGTEGFYLISAVGVGSGKSAFFGEVTIEGKVNGTIADVNKYTLNIEANPAEGGEVSIYPKADEYTENDEVTLTATKNFGYNFVNWTDKAGNVVSEKDKFTYTVTADETLTANFKKVNTYELKITVDGTNDYMVKITPAPTVVDGKNMYEEGTAVQLTADQYEGLVTFTNWSDGETNSNKTISMTEDVEVTAYYTENDIIVGWDFYTAGNNGRKADFASEVNEAAALNLVNTKNPSDIQGWLDKSTEAGGGYESFAGAAVNWRVGSENGDVGNYHWQTKLNVEDFTDINVQFQMLYNYNAYQTYKAEYSLNGQEWTSFGSLSMTDAKKAASFSKQMPEAANNQAELYIRLIADKTSKVAGTSSANDGNALAMFFITGTPQLVDDGKAPVLVSTVPANNAEGASATGKIVLTFDERIKLTETANAMLGGQKLTPAVSGKTVTFEYKALEYNTNYTFTLAANSVSDLTDNTLAEEITINFTTMTRPSVAKALYDFVVPTNGTFKEALEAAAKRTDTSKRFRIFVKKGDYVIPANQNAMVTGSNGKQYPDPKTSFGSPNVSIIGEDATNTSITNEMPTELVSNGDAGKDGKANPLEGIRESGVLYLTSGAQNTYFQDIKLWSNTDDGTGRNVVLVDGGNKTVCKNVTLWAYQDTYVSDNEKNFYYFEGGLLRGRTDFICGSGDVFFNGVTLQMCEEGGYISVPRANVKYGYVYKDCTIKGETSKVDGNYYLGRPWTEAAESYFINTTMEATPYAVGWADMSAGGCTRFAEYNSVTANGTPIDLSSRAKELGKETKNPNNPILTAEEALEIGNLHNMFGDWDPTLLTEQAPIPTNVKLEGTTLTWDDSQYALLWAISKNGEVIDFTITPTYIVDDAQAEYSVRAANDMGGLSEAAKIGGGTGIENVTIQPQQNDAIYTLQGVRVNKVTKGVYIINGKKVIIK